LLEIKQRPKHLRMCRASRREGKVWFAEPVVTATPGPARLWQTEPLQAQRRTL